MSGQDRYGLEVRETGGVWVVDLLAENLDGSAGLVKAYGGADALLRATAERDRLESLAASGVNPDATWTPLPAFVRPETLADAVRQAEHEHTAALSSLAAEAEVLRRATKRLLEVRRRVASLSQTGLSATQSAEKARAVAQDAMERANGSVAQREACPHGFWYGGDSRCPQSCFRSDFASEEAEDRSERLRAMPMDVPIWCTPEGRPERAPRAEIRTTPLDSCEHWSCEH